MNKKVIYIFFLLVTLVASIFLFRKNREVEKESSNSDPDKADFVPEMVSGTGKAIGAILLLIIVLVGGAIVMVFFGIGYGAKKAAKAGGKVAKEFERDFEGSLEKTAKAARTVRDIRGR